MIKKNTWVLSKFFKLEMLFRHIGTTISLVGVLSSEKENLCNKAIVSVRIVCAIEWQSLGICELKHNFIGLSEILLTG